MDMRVAAYFWIEEEDFAITDSGLIRCPRVGKNGFLPGVFSTRPRSAELAIGGKSRLRSTSRPSCLMEWFTVGNHGTCRKGYNLADTLNVDNRIPK
jgi:hypothetical protein